MIKCMMILLNNETSNASTLLHALNAWNRQDTSFQFEQSMRSKKEMPLTAGVTTPCRQIRDIQEKTTSSADNLDC